MADDGIGDGPRRPGGRPPAPHGSWQWPSGQPQYRPPEQHRQPAQPQCWEPRWSMPGALDRPRLAYGRRTIRPRTFVPTATSHSASRQQLLYCGAMILFGLAWWVIPFAATEPDNLLRGGAAGLGTVLVVQNGMVLAKVVKQHRRL